MHRYWQEQVVHFRFRTLIRGICVSRPQSEWPRDLSYVTLGVPTPWLPAWLEPGRQAVSACHQRRQRQPLGPPPSRVPFGQQPESPARDDHKTPTDCLLSLLLASVGWSLTYMQHWRKESDVHPEMSSWKIDVIGISVMNDVCSVQEPRCTTSLQAVKIMWTKRGLKRYRLIGLYLPYL